MSIDINKQEKQNDYFSQRNFEKLRYDFKAAYYTCSYTTTRALRAKYLVICVR